MERLGLGEFSALGLGVKSEAIMVHYAVPGKVVVQQVLSETVLFDTENGEYFELNSMGSEMFQQLRASGDPQKVVAALLSSYEVTEDVLRTDLDHLIDDLLEKGLLLAETRS